MLWFPVVIAVLHLHVLHCRHSMGYITTLGDTKYSRSNFLVVEPVHDDRVCGRDLGGGGVVCVCRDIGAENQVIQYTLYMKIRLYNIHVIHENQVIHAVQNIWVLR